MRKILPSALFLLLFLLQFFIFLPKVFADTPTPTPSPTIIQASGNNVPDNIWQIDPEVTFVGKTASRSGAFLDWALQSYKWSEGGSAISAFWVIIRNIVYAFLVLFVLATAFILIITQGKNITFSRFIPRFAGVVFLVTFSFALIQLIYQVADVIQLFFLKKADGALINSKDLLYLGFDYKNFIGYRLTGINNDESSFISLLLIKVTAITYYVMAGILIVRKIILWLLIIVSPIFPLLIFYRPIRNTGKIWIGEFFRWVLYAPLFAVFLGGIVAIWKASTSVQSGIPLDFNNFSGVGTNIVYPTAINILLGGPGQQLSAANSINLPQTFALYVVALMMLWGAVILPFILLRIFLDYLNAFSFGENQLFKQILSMGSPFLSGGRVPPLPVSPIPPTPPPAASFGMAKPFNFGQAKTLNNEAFKSLSRTALKTQTSEILKTVNIAVPTIHDIGRFETSRIDTSNIRQTLEKIANPALVSTPLDRQQFTQIKESLLKQQQKGDPLASAVLSASNTFVKVGTPTSFERIQESQKINEVLQKVNNPTQITQPLEREEYSRIREQLVSESQKGNSFASSMLTIAKVASSTNASSTTVETVRNQIKEEIEKGNPLAAKIAEVSQISTTKETSKEVSEASTVRPEIHTSKETESSKESEIKRVEQVLRSINEPDKIQTVEEKEKFTKIKEELTTASQKGDSFASYVLTAAKSTSKDSSVTLSQTVKERLIEEKDKGNPVAQTITNQMSKKGVLFAKPGASVLPVVNKVQTVSLDDYEAVKKMWQDNYQKQEVPQAIGAGERSKEQWINDDINKITQTINLLTSPDPQKAKEGMKNVSHILPFLLIGGFSQTEVIAYLKAKQEAGKSVLSEIKKKEEDEETKVDVEKKTEEKPKEMHAEAAEEIKQ